jgi:hypothetical protein
MEKLENNDILLYADSGCEIDIGKKERLKRLLHDVKNEKIIGSYPCKEYHPFLMERKWNKMDLLKYFNVENDDKLLNSNQRQASSIMILKTDDTMKLINEWYDICSNNYNFIDDTPSKEENFPDFEQHRHDQSVFSLLTKKYSIFSKMITIDYAIDIIRNRSGNSKI